MQTEHLQITASPSAGKRVKSFPSCFTWFQAFRIILQRLPTDRSSCAFDTSDSDAYTGWAVQDVFPSRDLTTAPA